MAKIVAFCPADQNNLPYFEMMKNSLRKFHSESELPLVHIDEKRVFKMNDASAYYRMTPMIGRELSKEYDIVLKLDADQIITAPLNELWETDYDVAVVNNSNPREFQAYSYGYLNIHPYSYVNCGFVSMRSKSFIEWWDNACHSTLFGSGQMREQDILNYMVHSGNYNVKRLDEGDSFWGLASKGYWAEIKLEDDKLILPKPNEPEFNPLGSPILWPDKKKIIRVLHWAGGFTPNKMNFSTRFQPEVVKRLEYLVSKEPEVGPDE